MDIEIFRNSPTGRLVPITVDEGGSTVEHAAFVPDPLPADLELSPKTWGAAIDAAHHLGRLDALAKELLPNPILIARPTIRREAVSTSALEGTFAPAADVLSSDIDATIPRSAAMVEILNFIDTTEHGIDRIATLPIGRRLACELQGLLVAGTPSDDWQAGNVRSTQVFIGPYRGCSISEARYVPPPPGPELDEGLRAWEQWIHTESDIHPVIRVAAAHYQFEALHPFTDGNGRIGRLLAILQLIDYGLLSAPLINLSPYFEAQSDRYRHRLREVSTTGAMNEWVTYFCEALTAQAQHAEARIHALLDWRDQALERIRSRRMSGTAVAVTERLIEYPSITVKHVAAAHGVSKQAANVAVARLVDAGILSEVTGRNYSRVFQAPDVLEILFRPGPTP